MQAIRAEFAKANCKRWTKDDKVVWHGLASAGTAVKLGSGATPRSSLLSFAFQTADDSESPTPSVLQIETILARQTELEDVVRTDPARAHLVF